MKIAPDEIGERLHLLGRLLHEKEIRLFPSHEHSNVLDCGAGKAQQIPTNDFQFDCPLRPTRELRTRDMEIAVNTGEMPNGWRQWCDFPLSLLNPL